MEHSGQSDLGEEMVCLVSISINESSRGRNTRQELAAEIVCNLPGASLTSVCLPFHSSEPSGQRMVLPTVAGAPIAIKTAPCKHLAG